MLDRSKGEISHRFPQVLSGRKAVTGVMQRFMARRATSEDEKEALDRNICGRACNTNRKTS